MNWNLFLCDIPLIFVLQSNPLRCCWRVQSNVDIPKYLPKWFKTLPCVIFLRQKLVRMSFKALSSCVSDIWLPISWIHLEMIPSTIVIPLWLEVVWIKWNMKRTADNNMFWILKQTEGKIVTTHALEFQVCPFRSSHPKFCKACRAYALNFEKKKTYCSVFGGVCMNIDTLWNIWTCLGVPGCDWKPINTALSSLGKSLSTFCQSCPPP